MSRHDDDHSTPGQRDRLHRRQVLVAGLGALALGPARATAAPAEVQAELPGARLQGRGQLRFLGLRVYEARLWVGPQSADAAAWQVPLALELEYMRALQGPKIAERSLVEMRRQGDIAPAAAERWLASMTRMFPDVNAGDRLTGFKQPGQFARFYLNGRPTGELRDPDFARMFFGIWLAPQTSEPALRQALLGQRA